MAVGDQHHEAVRHRDGRALFSSEFSHHRGWKPLRVVQFHESLGADVTCGERALHCASATLECCVEAFAFEFDQLHDVLASRRQLRIGYPQLIDMVANDL